MKAVYQGWLRAESIKTALYWDWIRSEAGRIGTDGCSMVSGLKVELCYEHDLGYYYGRDPRDAYELYLVGARFPWLEARKIDRAEVDARFRRGHQARSLFGRLSPMALWRWLGVKYGGQGAWDKHRERETGSVATL